MKLYELSRQFNELQELEPELIADTLEGIQLEINDKAKNIGYVYKNINAGIDSIDKEIKRLQAMRTAAVNRVESLKNYLRMNMERCDIKKIECELFKISRVAGRDIALIEDDQLIPKNFKKVVESVDKTALLKALKEGPVSGASIGKSKESIRIT